MTTDIAPGYDHITSAIGASISSWHGADLVCYITPAEHLALPNEADVVEGVKVARLAVHIGDLTKYPEKTRHRDIAMSKARRDLDWTRKLSQNGLMRGQSIDRDRRRRRGTSIRKRL